MREARLTWVCAAAGMLVLAGTSWRPAYAQAPTRDQIRASLEAGVEVLINQQQEDGSWKVQDAAHGGDGYDVGRTALPVLALLNAQRHVKSARVQESIHKGISFIVQQWPEAKTYTGGLVQQALYKADPTGRRYNKHISMYAWTLVYGQLVVGPQTGGFSYGLFPFPKDFDKNKNVPQGRNLVEGRADNSNSQFGVLGLLFSEKAGFQVPKVCWLRAQKYYLGAQHQDGSWDYYSDPYRQSTGGGATPEGTHNLTFAGTVSLAIANEMLYADKHDQCKPQPMSEPVEKGLEWIAKNWNNNLVPYGWYACERLGILMGYSEFGGTDWYEAGSSVLCGQVAAGNVPGQFGDGTPNLAFGIIFLSRGLEPIIFNKLKRTGDWNNHLHDISHATEYISDKFQYGKQWRIVTLNASTDYLLRVPILWISGHDKLIFTDAEKEKLKQYVERGGTILAEACCSKASFDSSFRALLAELWPDSKLQPIPATHPIYEMPRPLKSFRPQILGLAIQANQGRLGVLYLPNGISCQWERGGTRAAPSFDVATNIHFYVEKFSNRGKTPDEIAREKVPSREAPVLPPADTTTPPTPKAEVDEEAK